MGLETRENNIWIKDKSQPPSVFLHRAGGLWVIVRRAKQCLDFAATAHLIHLVNCCIYDGFPSSGSWWMLNLTCMALMAVIGEFVCMRTELKAIPVTVSSVKSSVWHLTRCSWICWWELVNQTDTLLAKWELGQSISSGCAGVLEGC